MFRVTRKWLDARLALLSRLLNRTDLEWEIWHGDGVRYQVKIEGGARDLSPVCSAKEMDFFLDGAIAIAGLAK